MKICCISDTHGLHAHFTEQIKAIEADVLIHAGDITSHGTLFNLQGFLEWFNGFSHIPNRIFIAGNHDGCLEGKLSGGAEVVLTMGTASRLNPRTRIVTKTHYLCNSGVEIDGIKFWGSPYTPKFMDWHFMYRPGEPAEAIWAQIPEDTNVLITHGPPLNIADQVIGYGGGHVGCPALLEQVRKVKPRAHIFGHIHAGYGSQTLDDTYFVNAALLDEQYKPTNNPIVFEL